MLRIRDQQGDPRADRLRLCGTNGVVHLARGDGYSTSGPRDVMRERPALGENWRQQLERVRTQADRAESTNGTIDHPAMGWQLPDA